jgi:hypothetical protein
MTIKPWSIAVCLAAVIAAPPSLAQPPAGPPRRITADGMPGVDVFTARRWGVVGVRIANPGDQPVELLSSHYFGDTTELQFARQFWIPPRTVRESWYPILPPEQRTRALALPTKSLLIDRTHGGETLLGERGGPLIHEGLLPAQPDTGPITGILTDPADTDGALLPQVARVAVNLSPRLARLDANTLPPVATAFQALDQLVVSSDRLGETPAAALAIRSWLHSGGRLWVRLDRVSPETVALLLGQDFPATVVDRVGLTKWTIVRERAVADPDDEAYDSAEKQSPDHPGTRSSGAVEMFEPPVEMVRVVVPGIQPVHTVDGWPASFWLRSGRGVVLFTTVGPRGWISPKSKTDPRAAEGLNLAAKFKESDALSHIATHFLKMRDPPPSSAVSLDPLLASQVGYRVADRRLVFGVLALFCFALLAGGWWLNRRGALAHLGWAGPLVAVVAAGLLVVTGALSRGRVPPTLASAQFVEVVPGVPDALVFGRVAFHAPEGAPANLGAEHGGVFVPDGRVGNTRRMVHTDLDRWRWENLPLPPGLHTAAFETTVRLPEPVSARATFGPDGLVGSITPGPFQKLEDAVLAMPSRHNFAVKFAPGSRDFVVKTGDRLPVGQYLVSGVLTGDQEHRRVVYQQLLEQKRWPRYPSQPTVFAWANPLDLGFTFVDGARRTGSALVAIPLELDRPAPATRVTIPAPFLSYRNVSAPGLTLLYNLRMNEWTTRTAPARTRFRFQVPAELLPLRVERAVLEIDLSARGRSVEVFAGAGGTVLATRAGTNGVMRIELTSADALQPDPNGGILVDVSVGAGTDEWKITDLRLDLVGQIAGE